MIVQKFSAIVPYLYLQFTHSAAAEAFKLRVWDADRVNVPIGMASDADGCQKCRRGPIYRPASSQCPPKPLSRPNSMSRPSVRRTSHPFPTVSVSRPLTLFVDIATLSDLALAASSRSLMRSSIP